VRIETVPETDVCIEAFQRAYSRSRTHVPSIHPWPPKYLKPKPAFEHGMRVLLDPMQQKGKLSGQP
jgi:hypothetical protein